MFMCERGRGAVRARVCDDADQCPRCFAESDRAMREELTSMPPEMQQKMKELLKAGEIPEEVWKDIFGSEF